MRYILPILFLALIFSVCGCAGNKSSAEVTAEEPEAPKGPFPSDYHDFPCAVFSDEILAEYFGIKAEMVHRSESKDGSNRTCNCHWDNTHKQVGLFVQPIFESPQDAADQFAQLTSPGKQIIVAETATEPQKQIEMAYDLLVPGIGDEAKWSSQLNQLVVRKKDEIFLLNVDVHENTDENRKLAETLAQLMMQ